MKEEILSIANEALNAIDEFENELFANHRARYAMSKSILDQHREHILTIKKGLELELDDAGFNDAKGDLNMIIEDVNNARNGKNDLKEPTIDTTQIDQMLNTLNEAHVETQYPQADVNVTNIGNTINALENMNQQTTVSTEGVTPGQPGMNNGITGVAPQQTPMQPIQPVDANNQITQAPMNPGVVPQANVTVPPTNINNDIDVDGLNAFMNTQVQQ